MSQPYIEKAGSIKKLFIKMQPPGLEGKANLFRLLAVTQKAGLGIRDALNSILKSEQHPGMKRILKDLIEQSNQGLSLADSMRNHRHTFKDDEIALIESAEKMGNLPEVLEEIADELERFQKIRGKIKSALTMPIVVIIVAIIAVVILLIKVLPTIVELFPNTDDLPGITKFMLDTSDYLQENRTQLLIIIIGSVVGYITAYKKFLPFKITIDRYILKVPVIGKMVQQYNLYRFSKLLGDFYKAGVSPTKALAQMQKIFNNYHYEKKLKNVQSDLEVGLSFMDAMEGSRLFDPILIQIMGIGESTGNLGSILNTISNFYRDRFNEGVEASTNLLEPILMVGVGVIVGAIVASIFLPMADLIGNIG